MSVQQRFEINEVLADKLSIPSNSVLLIDRNETGEEVVVGWLSPENSDNTIAQFVSRLTPPTSPSVEVCENLALELFLTAEGWGLDTDRTEERWRDSTDAYRAMWRNLVCRVWQVAVDTYRLSNR